LSDDDKVFPDAIWRSTVYWRNKTGVSGDAPPRYVLVDLLVDHPVYYLGNLLLAKYLQLTQGLRPLLLVSSQADQAVVVAARSFGFEDFTYVRDTVSASVSPMALRILAQLDGFEGAAFRQRVLTLEIDGVPVGDLLYDTYLREERRVTLDSLDDALRFHVVLLANYVSLYTEIMDSHDVAATVNGHLVYTRFGVLARLAARRGATVYVRNGGKGLRIQKRHSVAEMRDCASCVTADLIDGELAAIDGEAVAAGRSTLDRRMDGANNEFQFLNEVGYGTQRAAWTPQDFSEAIGLSPDRKVGLVMLHAFPDGSHNAPDLIFDDYYDWHIKTLGIVSQIPEIDWLIKLHPNLSHYTDDQTPRLITEKYAAEYPHILLAPDTVNTRSFSQIADFLVTANSKAGLEFAGTGVPVVTVARSFYSGLGFTVEPDSIEAYAEVLRRAGGLNLSAEQRDRALVANDLFYRRMICECAFIPDIAYSFWTPFNEIEFWRYYRQSLDETVLEDEPLYRAFSEFVASDDITMLRAR
jgi:hypothetical protein